MQQVTTQDQKWHVALEWSPYQSAWLVAIDRWERPGPFADWALEGRWVIPLVHSGHLSEAFARAVNELADQVQLQTGEFLTLIVDD